MPFYVESLKSNLFLCRLDSVGYTLLVSEFDLHKLHRISSDMFNTLSCLIVRTKPWPVVVMGESSNLAPRQVLAGWGLVVLLIPSFGEKIDFVLHRSTGLI